MAGKLCTGSAQNNIGAAHLRSSKAYCEGIAYRAQGTAIAFPITGNPHDGTGSEAETAWDAGWTVANAAAPGALGISACCSYTGVVAL